MNLQDARTLLDYHYWARDRMLEAVERLTPEQFTRDLGSSFRSVRDTVVHTYGAEWIWYARWQGESPTALPSAEDFPTVASVQTIWREHERKMRAFLERHDDGGLERVIAYKMTSGQSAASVLWHMLQHVVNHASYHRGQVTTLLRQLGVAPPKSTDLITYYREVGAKPVV